MKRIISAAICIVLTLALLAGCSGGNGDAPSVPEQTPPADSTEPTQSAENNEPAPEPEADSIVAYVGTSIFDGSLDPIKGAMSHGYSFTNCALLKVNPDSEYVGDMAESWTISDDALKYTFKLRSGITFSDGTPLTAEDVVFTYETAKAGQAENEYVDLSRLVSVTALDELTVGNDVTSDAAVREALVIGIDREKIIQNAYNGIGKPAASFTSNLVWADSGAATDSRADEARAILEAAGWVDSDNDGVREKNGIVCEFHIYAPEDRYVLIAALAEDAAGLGVRIVPHSSNWGEIAENMYTSGVIWGWGQYSPTVLYSLFSGEVALSGGWDNVVGYMNPEVDAAINKAINETSQEAAIADWKTVQALANADFPYLYIVNIEHCYFVSDTLDISIETQIPHPHGHGSPIICNMKDWTIK